MSHWRLFYHFVWTTKKREPLLPPAIELRVHGFLRAEAAKMQAPMCYVGGTIDHIHILLLMSKNFALCKLIEMVKKESSKWIKSQTPVLRNFYWQSGYAAFSVSESAAESVSTYIENQEAHHRKRTFQDELRELLERHKVEYDERYLWD